MRWLAQIPRTQRKLRSFAQDSAAYGPLSRHGLKLVRTVPIAAIVGSVGRAHELRSDFRSFHTWDGDLRYHAVRSAMSRELALPPVELYALEGRYYVIDGHHRVAAARSLGQVEIDAVVTEFRPAPQRARAS